jgi:intein/homing endonuclease
LSREDIIKSKHKPEEAGRNIRAYLEDPLAINYAMGYKDRKFSMSFDISKQIVQNLSIVAGIIQTRTNQVSSFATPYRLSKSVGYAIKHKNPARLTTKGEREMIQSLEKFVYNCGASDPNKFDLHRQRDDFEAFLKKIVRDSLMYDQFAAEVVPDKSGKPYEFLAVDASTIRLASRSDSVRNWLGQEGASGTGSLATNIDPTGIQYPFRTMDIKASDTKDPAYLQVVHGQIANIYSAEELMFGIRNPRTDIYIQGYGYSEVEQLVSIITSHLYAEEYNRQFFRQGSAPKGLLVFRGDNMSPDQLEGFRRQWKANLEGVSNSWKTPIMQSEQGVDWVNLNQSNKDMEYGQWMEYLIKVTCFPGSESVTMADGSSRNICDVFPGEFVRVLEGGSQEVKNVQVSKYSGDLITLGSSNSDPITCTDSHPIFAITYDELSKGEAPSEVRAKDITKEHYLVVPKPIISGNKHTLFDLSEWDRTPDHFSFFETAEETGIITGKEKCYKYQDLNEELAYFLGAYGARGTVLDSTVSYGIGSDAQRELLAKYVKFAFGNSPRRGNKARTYSFSDKTVSSFMRSTVGHSAATKYLPKAVLESSKPVKISYLSGIFDTLGKVEDDHSVRLSFVCQAFASQVRSLLLSFGVYSDEHTEETTLRNYYNLALRGEYLELLVDLVPGIFTTKLRTELELVDIEETGVLVGPKAYYVPVTYLSSKEVTDQAVYNLEVAHSHTYCINHQAVHNCAVFLIDPAELNFDLHGGVSQTPLFESSQEWKLKASRDRGLKPLLRFIAKHINNNVISQIDDNFVFDFVGLDELTEQEKHTLRTEQVQSYMTLNEIRRAEDLPDLDHGDVPMNPTYMQAIQTQLQLDQQDQQEQGASGGGAQAANPEEGQVPTGGENEEVPNYSDNFVKSVSEDYDEWEKFAGIEEED